MRIIGMIPARGGSKGLPKKNILNLNGKPLIEYTVDACKKSSLSDFYCSTDSEDVANVCNVIGCKVIKRPLEFASDTSSMLDVLNHFVSYLVNNDILFDAIMVLYPVYPFRTDKLISDAISFFNKNKNNVILGLHEPHTHPYLCRYINSDFSFKQVLDFDINTHYRRQTYPEMYEICHMISIIPKSKVLSINSQLYDSDSKGFIISNPLYAVNIDTKKDFLYAKFLLDNDLIEL